MAMEQKHMAIEAVPKRKIISNLHVYHIYRGISRTPGLIIQLTVSPKIQVSPCFLVASKHENMNVVTKAVIVLSLYVTNINFT